MSLLRHTPEFPHVEGQLGDRPVQAELPSAKAALPEMPVLEAEHLHKAFPLHGGTPFRPRRSVHAVDDVSLSLHPGRVTALVGESGSGKTTVARLLAGLYPPTSGTIR